MKDAICQAFTASFSFQHGTYGLAIFRTCDAADLRTPSTIQGIAANRGFRILTDLMLLADRRYNSSLKRIVAPIVVMTLSLLMNDLGPTTVKKCARR